MRPARAIGLSVITTLLFGAATAALAVSGAGAIIYQFDTSARSSGMGSATSAVFWADDANVWANPALLGCRQGLGRSLSCWPFVREAGDYLDMGESTAAALG